MNNEQTANTTTQTDTQQPAETGENAGRVFTQDEVNKIVSDRLERERAKAAKAEQPDPAAEKAQALAARESRLDCREFCEAEHLDPKLLDVLGTGDVETFKAQAKALAGMFAPARLNGPTLIVDTGGEQGNGDKLTDGIADAFSTKGLI